MKKRFILLGYLFWAASVSDGMAQVTFKPNGVQDQRPTLVAFKNAMLHIDAETVLENAMFIIKDGKFEAIGKEIPVAAGTQIIDLKGKHVYPGLVEAYGDYGMPEIKRARGGGRSFYQTQFDSEKKGAYNWNQSIHPEVQAAEVFTVQAAKAEALRKQGFSSAIVHVKDGIARGTSALVALGNTSEQLNLLQTKVGQHFSLDKGTSTQTFPVSLMGSVALLRQTLYDAQWYANGGQAKERNISLETLYTQRNLPQLFDARNVLEILRVDRIGDEFGMQFIIKTSGDEYQKVSEVKATQAPLIVPIQYPEAYDVEDPYDAERTSLTDMKHWELAPKNLAFLHQAGIPFAITTSDLKKTEDFWINLRKAVQYGLPKNVALASITQRPAQLMKVDQFVGSIKKGLLANFFIASDDVFESNTKILQNWVQGQVYEIQAMDPADWRGDYALLVGNQQGTWKVTGASDRLNHEILLADSTKITPKVTIDGQLATISYVVKGKTIRLSGYYAQKKWQGKGFDGDGKSVNWSATIQGSKSALATETKKSPEVPQVGDVIFPFTAFGAKEKPKQETILIRNATVWTNEKEGILSNTDVLLDKGKIAKVGKNLTATNAKIIDGTGKHVTTGIIDEHSHIALFSINEIETVSSEVRQGDVINSEDVNIYRQLAGGTTTSQLLHGSANSIGGQSALVKLKWGESPEAMKIPQAPEFIKFALGENVKRGNGPSTPDRYPATRMGVEQVMFDAFTRAKAYQKEWAQYNGLKNKSGVLAPRRDLELEALVEILEGKRHITCHSYVQSEINMLMNVADSMGFKVNTFTHILEGYKVAEQMKKHNAAASTFSDWWAYKMEVKEAIPFNAALLHKAGILTAINSDDAEMARRLNQEAAKTVLYGGLSEEEAWKTITLNPAKMLHLDNRLGSMKEGKDGDVVVWNANPLSVYARPEKTIIDGTIYFDSERDEVLRQEAEQERQRIVQKMISAKTTGAPTQRARPMGNSLHVHCDTLIEFGGISSEALDMTLRMINQSTEKE